MKNETEDHLHDVALRQVEEVAGRLEDPVSAFGDGALIPSVTVDVGGGPFLVYDCLSYENGATGAIGLLRSSAEMTSSSVSVSNYGLFIRESLKKELLTPSPALSGAIFGALIAARRFSLFDHTWLDLKKSLEAALRRKALAEIGAIGSCVAQGVALPGFESFDLLRGLSRDAILLAESDEQASRDLALDCAVALADLLAPFAQNPSLPSCWVEGAPFLSGPRAGVEMESHINLGTAHGAAGVLLAIVHTMRTLEATYHNDDRLPVIRRVVSDHVDRMLVLEEAGTLPMFAVVEGNRALSIAPVQLRPSWCYGATGNQLCMLSAGIMLSRLDVMSGAKEHLLKSAERIDLFEDLSLCHGNSGLAVGLSIAGSALGDSDLVTAARLVSKTITAQFDAATLFGFTYGSPGLQTPLPVPGLFNGATGVATALARCFSEEKAGASGLWELSSGAPWVQPLDAPGR